MKFLIFEESIRLNMELVSYLMKIHRSLISEKWKKQAIASGQ